MLFAPVAAVAVAVVAAVAVLFLHGACLCFVVMSHCIRRAAPNQIRVDPRWSVRLARGGRRLIKSVLTICGLCY